MSNYKIVHDIVSNKDTGVLHIEKNMYIPVDERNIDYQAYLKWLAEGNTPLPADE